MKKNNKSPGSEIEDGFDITEMEKLVKEDLFIGFQVKDLSKRNPDMKREEVLKVVFYSSVFDEFKINEKKPIKNKKFTEKEMER